MAEHEGAIAPITYPAPNSVAMYPSDAFLNGAPGYDHQIVGRDAVEEKPKPKKKATPKRAKKADDGS